jgi:Mannosyl-glycoprotein endo-beta-N-acetylglucosaminidase
MKNNKHILGNSQKFIYSLFLVSSTLTTGSVQGAEQSTVDNQKGIIETIVSTITQEIESLSPVKDTRADRIDAYFAKYDTPLAGQGKHFVVAADKNGIDWKLLPAIAMMESSGGQHEAKKFNPFGWNCPKTCRHGFASYAEAILTVAENLGGNNQRTAKYYADKSVKQILETYNPPSVRPDYVPLVMGIMKKIEKIEIAESVIKDASNT